MFTVTGAIDGSVWGTGTYTDDSALAAAAVHAGVVAPGESANLTVEVLPGQASYKAIPATTSSFFLNKVRASDTGWDARTALMQPCLDAALNCINDA